MADNDGLQKGWDECELDKATGQPPGGDNDTGLSSSAATPIPAGSNKCKWCRYNWPIEPDGRRVVIFILIWKCQRNNIYSRFRITICGQAVVINSATAVLTPVDNILGS